MAGKRASAGQRLVPALQGLSRMAAKPRKLMPGGQSSTEEPWWEVAHAMLTQSSPRLGATAWKYTLNEFGACFHSELISL